MFDYRNGLLGSCGHEQFHDIDFVAIGRDAVNLKPSPAVHQSIDLLLGATGCEQPLDGVDRLLIVGDVVRKAELRQQTIDGLALTRDVMGGYLLVLAHNYRLTGSYRGRIASEVFIDSFEGCGFDFHFHLDYPKVKEGFTAGFGGRHSNCERRRCALRLIDYWLHMPVERIIGVPPVRDGVPRLDELGVGFLVGAGMVIETLSQTGFAYSSSRLI
jgi:hypothetical protein